MRTPPSGLFFATVAFSITLAPAAAQEPLASPDGHALPLAPTRSLQFTTDEGTWISVDVSPDGTTIVFDLLGDLYTLPMEGGSATRITSGQGFDAQPRYSPEGNRIVFVSDRDGSDNLWIANADGSSPQQLTDTEWHGYVSPEWTPDGEYILSTRLPSPKERNGRSDLYLYHTAGTTGLQLTGHEEAASPAGSGPALPTRFVGAAFGPDPRYVWIAAASGGGWGSFQITKFDRETGLSYRRTNELQGGMRPTLSPDGRWLVYATRREAEGALRLRDLATGEETWLVEDGQRDDQEGRWTRDLAPGSSFTPDSRALITSYGGRIMRVEVPSGEASVIPFTADVDQTIGPLALFEDEASPDLVDVRHVQWPRPSPDGNRRTFSAVAKVWVQDLPDGRPRRLTGAEDRNEHAPAWSPDGEWIAWVSWQDGVGGHVWKARANGSGAPQQLSRETAYYDRVAWAPDGTRILAVRAPARERIGFFDELNRGQVLSRDLVWFPASGGGATVISPLKEAARYVADYYGVPHFGPDPERVFLHEPSTGLISMRWDGTDRRTHLKVEAWDWPAGSGHGASEMVLSPDGTRALVLVNQNLWLVDLPPSGGEPPTLVLPAQGETPVPVRKLSRYGADFPGWVSGGEAAYWALGPSVFQYDMEAGDRAWADSVLASAGGTEADVRRYAPLRTDVALSFPAAKRSGTVAFTGARLITMVGDQIIENGTIVVDGERILAAGPSADIDVPSGAQVLDATGTTIVPGWIDIHAHMWAPWGVQRQQPWEYSVNLAYGVTTTRDPQTMTPDVFSYADRVAMGDALGPRVFATGRGINGSEEIGSLEHARDVVGRYSEFWKSGTIKQYQVGDRKVRQWIVMAAYEQGLSPTVEGGQDFKMNLTLMLDGYAGVEHSLPIWPLYRDVQELVRQSGITYTPTLIVAYGGPPMFDYYLERERIEQNDKLGRFMPRAEVLQEGLRRNRWVRDDQWAFPHIAREAARLMEAGGRVGMGSHGNLQGLGAQWELWSYGLGDMKPLEIIRAATLYGAHAIGMEGDLGS
ncbi:MAG: amidohydrolase, partial [Gemmatimonadetes bacterium]|nr:amidohydrolase [Gemmatimonadota bacterium]